MNKEKKTVKKQSSAALEQLWAYFDATDFEATDKEKSLIKLAYSAGRSDAADDAQAIISNLELKLR